MVGQSKDGDGIGFFCGCLGYLHCGMPPYLPPSSVQCFQLAARYARIGYVPAYGDVRCSVGDARHTLQAKLGYQNRYLPGYRNGIRVTKTTQQSRMDVSSGVSVN